MNRRALPDSNHNTPTSEASGGGQRNEEEKMDRDALDFEYARLGEWLHKRALEKSGTPEFSEAIKLHRIATDIPRRPALT